MASFRVNCVEMLDSVTRELIKYLYEKQKMHCQNVQYVDSQNLYYLKVFYRVYLCGWYEYFEYYYYFTVCAEL